MSFQLRIRRAKEMITFTGEFNARLKETSKVLEHLGIDIEILIRWIRFQVNQAEIFGAVEMWMTQSSMTLSFLFRLYLQTTGSDVDHSDIDRVLVVLNQRCDPVIPFSL